MVNDMPLYQKKDFSDKGDFILMLGGACNMCCRHCAQMPIREKNGNFKITILPKVWQMMDNYIQFALAHPEKQHHIYFYGGEALLYWSTIQEVVLYFVKKYDIFQSKALRFGTQSNGLLLTQDKVDFLNEFDMSLGFSYDAPYPFAVRGYVPDKICELVRKVKNYSITPTCSNAYNYDVLLANRCLRAKFPEAKEIRNTYNLTFSFDMDKDIYNYDWDKVKKSIRKLRIGAQLGNKIAIDWFLLYFKSICKKSEYPTGIRVATCLLNHVEIPITVDGRYSACQNGSLFFGTVDDSLDEIKERLRRYLEKSISPECETCQYQDICKIHCQLDLRNKDNSYVTCRMYWWPLLSIFKEEMRQLPKPLSEEDRVWYQEQEKIMEQQVQDFLLEGQRYEREHTALPKDVAN